jgi:hypothetical protein
MPSASFSPPALRPCTVATWPRKKTVSGMSLAASSAVNRVGLEAGAAAAGKATIKHNSRIKRDLEGNKRTLLAEMNVPLMRRFLPVTASHLWQ